MPHFLLCLYILQVVMIKPDFEMTIQDFQNIHSYHKITAEVFEFRLFWKLSKNIGFHRNTCKKQIVYGDVTQS